MQIQSFPSPRLDRTIEFDGALSKFSRNRPVPQSLPRPFCLVKLFPGPPAPCAWFSEVAGHSFADCAVSNGRRMASRAGLEIDSNLEPGRLERGRWFRFSSSKISRSMELRPRNSLRNSIWIRAPYSPGGIPYQVHLYRPGRQDLVVEGPGKAMPFRLLSEGEEDAVRVDV